MTSPQPLRFGTAWYPEQWPEERWEADLQLMEAAHMNVVRVAEFAWSTMEPSEGHFDFTWLDHAITLAAKHHIAVVLGTPTAAPPAWLTTKYPETLRVDEDGKRAEHGNRQHFSFTSPRYRELSARIALEMAKHFGHNPNVIGWQLDNELAAPSFDPSAKQQFHLWLQHRYGTIAELNRRWATAYWSQTYDNFDEIPVHAKGENPALLLDWKRFATDTWVDYMANQINVIRPNIAPGQFITTNTMHWFQGFDHYVLHRSLDIAAWDDYYPDGHLDPVVNAVQHDLVRGFKQKNFWVMETQPGFVNWGAINTILPPGVTREMAWQAVGHGADAVLYWQWRSALNGQEEYHGTLLGADGTPVPIYAELQKTGAEFEQASKALAGTSLHASVAVLQSYDSHWAIDFQKHSQKFDYEEQFTDLYRALQPLAQNIDILSPDADLTGYKVVFAPSLNVISDATAKNLLAYVQRGGHLVLGPRSGMKNGDNALQPERQPGPLAAALGGHVAQYYALDKPVEITGPLGSGSAAIWAEELSPTAPDAKVLMTYADSAGWLAGKPAAIEHGFGKGSITYIGATLDAGLMKAAVTSSLSEAEVHPILPGLPADVELMDRSSAQGAVWIFINHGSAAQHVETHRDGTELLSGKSGQSIELPPHGVAVYQLARRP
ncbi:beta-galactosidase [Granulicella sp. WH15]|uniref:beta-galactosidase n=1 Tax=Granulicella sp. WH15 TaxID=2602070 RepID=UPI001366D789|nr:beta-galactosidase [Granulicella sp. WH15]QHN02993.1 beta-galactosidase [Granulicella sp. WH15]